MTGTATLLLALSLALALPSIASGFVVPSSPPLVPSAGRSCRRGKRSSSNSSSSGLGAVSTRQVAVLDGAELASVQSFLASERDDDEEEEGGASAGRIGYMTVVAGTTEGGDESRRVVGVEIANNAPRSSDDDDDDNDNDNDAAVSLGNGVSVYSHTVATIPPGVSDDDAVSTMVSALAGVHCALPRTEGVGGDDSEGGKFAGGRVVVLGGGDLAVFCADGLAALGADVTLVSTGNPKTKMGGVQVMKPAVGPDDEAFASVVGKFDSLLDTLYDEGKADANRGNLGRVLRQLQVQNGCDTYVSTFSESQRIVKARGLLFGRGDAAKYVTDAVTKSLTAGSFGSGANTNIVPPKSFGTSTVQTLLDGGVVLSAGKNKGRDVFVRDWSLKDFWEYTSWPRYALDGGENVRFGLPVVGDDEDDAEEDELSLGDDAGLLDGDEAEAAVEEVQEQASPYVVQIRGVDDLNRKVVGPKRHGVVFMSATWCRKCKYLRPQYARLAREAAGEVEGESLTYAQADTTGIDGKMLSRTLNVDAVPTFVLFRDGKVYGEPLYVPRLPSKKLDLAVEYLTSGRDFDSKVIGEAK